MKCLCGGRGWVVPHGEEWWRYCSLCSGKGKFSLTGVAKLLGVSVGVIKKVNRCETIRASTAVKILDRVSIMTKMIDRR